MSLYTGTSDEAVLGKAYDAQLMKRLWTFVRPHWRLLLAALVAMPIAVGLELAQPYLLKVAIDEHIAVRQLDGLGRIAALYALLVALQAVVSYAELFFLQLLGQRSMHDLRLSTYRHVLAQRHAFFDRIPVGRLLTRMTNDIESINEMFASGMITILADGVKLVSIVVMMLLLDVELTFYTFLTLPLLLFLVEYARRIMRSSFRAIRVQIAAMNAFVQEHLSGIKVVQLFGRQGPASRDYDQLNAAHRDAHLGAIRADASMYAFVEAIGVLSIACVAWHAGGEIGDGAFTVGLVVAFIEYIHKFFIPVRDLSAKYTVMQQAMAASERIVALLDTSEPDAPPPARPVAPAGSRTTARPDQQPAAARIAIAFDQVRFAYRPGETILDGVSFTVARGETVAVVGATGSGKSTLIKLLTRLYEVDGGSIRLAGRDIRELPTTELRQRLTLVSQDVFLFAGTLAENIELGRLGVDRAAITAALARVGGDRLLANRDRGLDAPVSERGSNFSAGERQLIAFARALVRDPEILILDEATAHVDPEAETLIETGLAALMEGRTSLVIAHRLSTIARADRLLVMERGRIAESGSRSELLARGGLYAALERAFRRSH
jgi:ATP-binding cassette subfamily B protein